MSATRIDLGLAPAVRLGRLQLDPAVRVILRDDGTQEVIEPRVMQVLLALADQRGAIVRREELTERCWDGRIVGEDAINRVLSRLRRVAEGIGKGSFHIETVTRIGYRLTEMGRGPSVANGRPLIHLVRTPSEGAADAGEAEPSPGSWPTRRTMLAGAATAGGLVLAGGGTWWATRRPALPAPARQAMERGTDALRVASLDQLTIAAAAFREATELAPRDAEAWGSLALAYRWLSVYAHGQEAELNAVRAREAARQALHLDPDNGSAQATLATLQPMYRNWLAYDDACKPVLARHPDEVGIAILYIDLLSNVGRIREINALSRRWMALDPSWLGISVSLTLSSFCLGQLDEADAAIDRAMRQWPRNINLWFIRQRVLAYSGRAAIALEMIADVDHRPVGVPAWNFDLAEAETRALLTRSKADIDKAAGQYEERARRAVGEALNGAEFLVAVGRMDEALRFFEAVYFHRGFDPGERAYSDEQGAYAQRRNRATWHFWLPFMADFRADPRGAAMMREMRLVDYWRKSGTRPDFPVAALSGS